MSSGKRADYRRNYLNRRGSRLGVTCLICGDGPYVKLGVHTARVHGIPSRQYRRMFPDAEMTHPDLKEAWALEGKEKGFPQAGHRRRRTCRRGHALRGDNVITSPKWPRIRACRKCVNERRRARLRERSAQSGTKLCECGCGTEIPQISSKGTPQRFAHNHHMRVRWREQLRG
jgi:hypothetical protein